MELKDNKDFTRARLRQLAGEIAVLAEKLEKDAADAKMDVEDATAVALEVLEKAKEALGELGRL